MATNVPQREVLEQRPDGSNGLWIHPERGVDDPNRLNQVWTKSMNRLTGVYALRLMSTTHSVLTVEMPTTSRVVTQLSVAPTIRSNGVVGLRQQFLLVRVPRPGARTMVFEPQGEDVEEAGGSATEDTTEFEEPIVDPRVGPDVDIFEDGTKINEHSWVV
ncbi:hypothetical protein PHLGIDRAFT_113862 [Phlebiopsis gigantea 11061_1 CR5-6]|uniref:Uncharacterized protein n=1 Tax=Phlebiopsis gigantea (strain 11061_1 CR5-6) TaxID=745531 RepID=A0A0C3S7F3_PHLG1|nr:hypothetical protein PHLGIDRAFT_113862 [Phlebiopsis gigantea 11061_1 CR5-6]